MSKISRQTSLEIAAEKMRQKREKEKREEREFYERITSGIQWLLFKIVVIFCSLVMFTTIIETFVDGPVKKISEDEWQINRDWEYRWHKVLDVEGYMFTPHFKDWNDHVEGSLELTYSPIFRTGKKLSYDMKEDHSVIRRHSETRQRSIFTWFPFVQLFLLIPLLTFLFKRQAPWFNFARILSLGFVFPGALLLIIFTLS